MKKETRNHLLLGGGALVILGWLYYRDVYLPRQLELRVLNDKNAYGLAMQLGQSSLQSQAHADADAARAILAKLGVSIPPYLQPTLAAYEAAAKKGVPAYA